LQKAAQKLFFIWVLGVKHANAQDRDSKKVFLLRAGRPGFSSEKEVLAYC
jgi:hypothetical protein